MLQRVSDWRSRLVAVVHEWENRPFVWGETDCACFAAECVRAVTGADPLGTLRGNYNSRLSAFARLRFRGHSSISEATHAALSGLGCTEIPPRFAMVGDIAATPDDILAVRMPIGFIARARGGGYATVKAERAWRI